MAHRSTHGHRIRKLLLAGALSAAAVGVPAVAGAAPYPDGGTPTVTPNNGSNVSPNTTTRSATLPFTGGDMLGAAAIGAAMIGSGVALRTGARRRATH
jgi:hypothetical protein